MLLAAILYVDHHRLIRNLDYDVVSTTPSLSTPRKLYLAARARLAWQRNPDPRAVFRTVSAIPADETGHWLNRSMGRLPVP